MSTSAPPPYEGLVAGKYQLVRLIGRGGMGSVWEARHVSLGTSSAIKFIEAEYADSREARSRFDREARAAATIQSKHAIQVYDHGVTDDGKPYIVMELLRGEALDKRIERFGRLSLEETARILRQVCRGLSHAHERGIVHRDLKPENIFLVRSPDDDEEVAKVLDFGIAKIQASPGNLSATSSTKTGAVLGTPFYMAPEQARGLRNVDHRADIWSLGVIAFKCVTGRLPFDGESIGDLLVKICTLPPPIPSQVAPDLPPNFDAWFLRALEREPERRFATVSELSDALCFAAGAGAATGPSASAVAMPPVGPAGAPTPFPSAPGAHATPAGAALGGSAPRALPDSMTNAPFTSERSLHAPKKRGQRVMLGVAAGALVLGATVSGLLFMRTTLKAGMRPGADVAEHVTAPSPAFASAPEPKAAAPDPALATQGTQAEEPPHAGGASTATAPVASSPGSGHDPVEGTTASGSAEPEDAPAATAKTGKTSPAKTAAKAPSTPRSTPTPAVAPPPAPPLPAKKPSRIEPGY